MINFKKKRYAMNQLTTKQNRFVEEYVTDFNASRAAVSAGYSEKTARSIASELLTKPDIRSAIKQQLDKLSAETFINREMILTGLLKEAMDRGERCTSAARISAWDKLAKVSGLYIDVQVTTTVDDIIRDITTRNAANRNGLLPKDNCWLPPLEPDEQDGYYSRRK
jgi:phage terminase small subunit